MSKEHQKGHRAGDLTVFEKLSGRRYGNIQLPPEGPRDPKLPTKTPLEKVAQGVKTLRDKGVIGKK